MSAGVNTGKSRLSTGKQHIQNNCLQTLSKYLIERYFISLLKLIWNEVQFFDQWVSTNPMFYNWK